MTFADVGAVVYYARLVPWAFPRFDPVADEARLRALHAQMVRDGGLETSYERFWLRAER